MKNTCPGVLFLWGCYLLVWNIAINNREITFFHMRDMVHYLENDNSLIHTKIPKNLSYFRTVYVDSLQFPCNFLSI